jgi:hypothetical protein
MNEILNVYPILKRLSKQKTAEKYKILLILLKRDKSVCWCLGRTVR